MWGSDRAGGKRLSVAAVVAVLGVAVAWVQPAAGQTTQPPPPKCENFSCQDPLFTVDYPAKDTFVTSHGVEVHAPAQFYNSKAFLVFGSGDLRFASKLAAGTGYQPVQTDDGHAIVDLDLNEWDDTNLGPYHEMILIVPVNRGKVVVKGDDPYQLLGASVDPENPLLTIKLIVDTQLAVDVGREYYHLDKVTTPQVMSSDIAPSLARFSVTDPHGHPVVSGSWPIDTGPSAQGDAWSRFSSTPGFGRMIQDTAIHAGGLTRFGYVYRDVSDPSVMRQAHAAGRVVTDPSQAAIGPRTSDATFDVHAGTEFGTLLQETAMNPVLGIVFNGGRWVLANGPAPATEPGLTSSSNGTGASSTSGASSLEEIARLAP